MSTTSTTETETLNVNLLLSSFLKIEPQADEFAASFYEMLFMKYPKVRILFANTDMEKQKAKLIESLQLVMVNVHNNPALTTILKNLGKRHVQYGAVLTDYPLIGDALLLALEKHLGKDWTQEVQQTWTLAYQMIADTMAEGAKTVHALDVDSIVNRHVHPELTNIPEYPTADDPAPDLSSDRKPVLAKLIILVSFGLTGLCGYMAWNLMQSQTNPATPSNPIEQGN